MFAWASDPHMLEGTWTSLVQAGLQLLYWLLAMQHFSNGADAPCNLRSDENFPGQQPKEGWQFFPKDPPNCEWWCVFGIPDPTCFSGVSISAYARGTCWWFSGNIKWPQQTQILGQNIGGWFSSSNWSWIRPQAASYMCEISQTHTYVIPIWWCRLFSWGSTTKLIILKSPIWSDLHMLTLRPFEPRKTILVQNMSKIFQDYFANVQPQESNVHGGGVHWNIYVRQTPGKKCPMIIWGGMVLYMTLKGWKPGFKSVEMVL